MQINSAVIPVAGIGTRAFPLTTAIEKCMLPVYAGDYSRPLIDYMVDDCARAGIKRIIFITSERGKVQLEDYFGKLSKSITEQLSELGKKEIISNELDRRNRYNIDYEFIIQPHGLYGTAVPLYTAREALRGEDRFVMMGGDDFVYHRDGLSELSLAIEAWKQQSTDHAIMGVAVSREEAPKYGVLRINKDENLTSIDEKPSFESVPENPVVNITRYLFNQSIWAPLEEEINVPRGNNEHYITYAINDALRLAQTFKVHRVKGKYFDGGNYQGLLEASQYITMHPPLSFI